MGTAGQSERGKAHPVARPATPSVLVSVLTVLKGEFLFSHAQVTQGMEQALAHLHCQRPNPATAAPSTPEASQGMHCVRWYEKHGRPPLLMGKIPPELHRQVLLAMSWLHSTRSTPPASDPKSAMSNGVVRARPVSVGEVGEFASAWSASSLPPPLKPTSKGEETWEGPSEQPHVLVCPGCESLGSKLSVKAPI